MALVAVTSVAEEALVFSVILLVGAYYGVDLSGLVGTPDFSGQSSQRLETQEEQ